jgi:hypothetical protein
LAIFVHLFAVFVAVTTYTRPSAVQEQLHALFSPYLRNLQLTPYPVTYPFARYHLTHATTSDIDFTCEVDVENPGGQSETVSIPAERLWPPLRMRRYQAIANVAGALAQPEGNEDLAGVIPKAIAGSILKQRGLTQGLVRIRYRFLPDMETFDPANPARSVGPVRELFEAQVFLSGDRIEMLKKSATLEVAPVEGKAKPSSAPKGAGGANP